MTAFWSLNYEEQFYLAMALLLLVPSRRWRLAWMLGLMPLSLLWRVQQPFLYRGIFVEYWLYFGLGGVVFWRLCRVRRRTAQLAVDLTIFAAAMTSTYLYLRHSESAPMPLLLQELPVVTWFAVLLIYLRPFDRQFAASALARPFMALGLVSYSLYLIHQSNLTLCKTLAGHLISPHWLVFNAAMQLILQVGLAAIFWHFCERPFMNPRLSVSTTPAATNENIRRRPL